MSKDLDFLQLFELYNNGDYTKIINNFDSKNYKAAEDPDVSKIYAAAFFQRGDFQMSYNVLLDIESCFTEDAEYYSIFGACCRRLGKFDESRIHLQTALKLDPQNASINNNFANLLIDLNEFDEAESILKKLLIDNPNFEDAEQNLVRLAACRSMSLKSNYSQTSLETPNEEKSWKFSDPLLLAFSDDEVHESLERFNVNVPETLIDKVNKLQAAVPELPQNAAVAEKISLACRAIQEKRFDFALKLCSQAKKSLPLSPAVYDCASDAYIGLSQFRQAEICLLHCLSLGSPSFKIFANLVSILCMKNDFSLAKFYLEKARVFDPTNVNLQALSSQIFSNDNESRHSFSFDTVGD